MRFEGQIKKLHEQAKAVSSEKYTTRQWKENHEKWLQIKNTTGRNELNSKGTRKERSNPSKIGSSKMTKENLWRKNKEKWTTRCNGNKHFRSKIWEQKEHNRKAEWVSKMTKITRT